MITGADNSEYSRLMWQCRRGMLELDTLLQGYLKKCYADLTEEDKEKFCRLLECHDQDLLWYLMGYETPREGELIDVINRIRDSV